jgi:ribosome-associated protein
MSDLSSLEKARIAAAAALERRAVDPLAIDVHALVSFADVFVVLTGHSDRQVRAIAEAVSEAFSLRGEKPLGVEGLEQGRWVLMDLSDVIVHVFQEEVRNQYDLERLWSDAPRLDLGLPPPDARRHSAH